MNAKCNRFLIPAQGLPEGKVYFLPSFMEKTLHPNF